MLNRKKAKKNIIGENAILLLGLLVASIFLLLDSSSILKPLRNGVSYIFSPVYADAKKAGGSLREYVGTVGKISEFRKEYNELKISTYEKDINNAHYQSLKEENDSLRKQIVLGNIEKKYLLAKVLSVDNISDMQVDKGSRENVKEGAVVSLGNMFVGIVQRVDSEGALVLLPYSKSSTFEVFVTNIGVEEGKIVQAPTILSKAVVIGAGDYINIENISMNSNVKDGDIVIAMDKRIGEYLVVGRIANLITNPAATSMSGRVTSLVDYDDLMTIFIEIE